VPSVESKLLAKDLKISDFKRKDNDPSAKAESRDVDVLVKLLPFYELDLTLKKNEADDVQYLRRLLSITRSDAEMMKKNKGI
jgi:hypothetical protein